MQPQNCDAYTSSNGSNHQLALDPQQVSVIGSAFKEAWLQFAAAAPAGMDLFAEASMRQLSQFGSSTNAGRDSDRNALITLALQGL